MSEEREMYATDEIEVANGGTDLIPTTPNLPTDPTAYIAQVEAWMEFLTKLHKTFYKALNPKTDLCFLGSGDKSIVHLTKPGMERLLAICGGEIRVPKDDKGFPLVRRTDGEDDRGKWYAYEAAATFIRGDGKVFDASYMVSSRNRFFGVAYGKDKQVTEILPDYVREAAIGWAIKKAVARGLGVSSFTLDQLQEAGVRVEQINGYTFTPKQQPAKQTPKQEPKSTEPERISAKHIDAIHKWMEENKVADSVMLNTLGDIGYERLVDLPLSKYETFKTSLKERAGK